MRIRRCSPPTVGGYAYAAPRRYGTIPVMAPAVVHRILTRVTALAPVDPRTKAALVRRWDELPESARTPAQVLGRYAVGCEGTQGVFARCNFTCSPCYHSKDANHVRVDGPHTLRSVTAQMELLRHLRGPHAHAQLIGGEVSLLSPDDHARAMQIMRKFGREPMSFTHGDLDYDYLRQLAVQGRKRRFARISFAAHFDVTMRGRRGLPRPRHETELNPFRERFTAMFKTLRDDFGVRYFLAHNMTVTPENLPQIREIVRDLARMDFGLLSFQPAAYVGDERRWQTGYGTIDVDAVWRELEHGLGQDIPWNALQFGDTRCNRTAFGFFVGLRWFPILDGRRSAEVDARDRFFRHFGGMQFSSALSGRRGMLLLLNKIVLVLIRHPYDIVVAAKWGRSVIERVGGSYVLIDALLRRKVKTVTFVVHSFMHAEDVKPAWEAMRRGENAIEPSLRVVQERLAACSFSMAHPETGELVPACVQHSVLDTMENHRLRKLLPLYVRPPSS